MEDITRGIVGFIVIVLLVVGTAAFAVGRWIGVAYKLTADDINLMKDAAAVIGPGDPIARQLWRLAERAEGK
jgi:hypothetical protein